MANDDQYGDEHELPAETGATEAYDDAEAEQLDLGADEEHLPWLDSDEDYAEEGVDTARIVAFALVGLAVIALIVGGIWWFSRQNGAGNAADGSTIAAPKEPYKTKPAEPGGKTFEGTGDESFAVAEGQEREGQLATSETPKPSVDAATVGETAAPASNAVGVQVGAFSTRDNAVKAWSKLANQFAALKGRKYRIVEVRADNATLYGLQALAPDLATANSLCDGLRAAGGACQVKP
jgi:hypothetical protein